jgi:hypothetical protein
MCNLVYNNIINKSDENLLLIYLLEYYTKQYNLFNSEIKNSYGVNTKIIYLNQEINNDCNFIGYCIINDKIIIKIQISIHNYSINIIGNFNNPISITSTNLINISDTKGFVIGTNNGSVYVLEISGLISDLPLAYFDNNNKNSSILSIINQPIDLLNRFTNDLFYLWIIYENSIELYYFKIDINTNYINKPSIRKGFTLQLEIPSYGKFQLLEILNTRYGIGSFLAIHFINNFKYDHYLSYYLSIY